MTTFTSAVVGFQDIEANALILFKDLAYPDLNLITVPRAYSVTYQLCLPSSLSQPVDFYLLDLEGLGLSLYDSDVTAKIMDYTAHKPTILVSRYALEQWQHLALQPQWQFLSANYKRQQIQEAIDKAIATIKSTAKNVTTIQSKVAFTPVEATFDQLKATFKDIDSYFYFILFRQIALLNTYTKLTIENHSLYINPFDKSGIVHRLGGLIDRLSILRRTPTTALLKIETLDEAQFNHQTQKLLDTGVKKMPLSQLIWQIGLELVQSNQFSNSHQLFLKVNYMPNLAGINYVPSYIIPIIASCLGKAKPFSVLQNSFPNLTNGQLNQVMVLMVCSQIIDTSILLMPQAVLDNNQNTTPDSTANTDIAQAQSSGFFRRLLNKLNF